MLFTPEFEREQLRMYKEEKIKYLLFYGREQYGKMFNNENQRGHEQIHIERDY